MLQQNVRAWEFTDRKSGETRQYQQAELTIDGEMQLFALLNKSVVRLQKANFPFDRLGEVFAETVEAINWGTAAELISLASTEVPPLAAEAAATFLGIFPFDEYGARNDKYVDEVAFLRRNIRTADLVEMIETFIEQNDIERLRAPFVKAAQKIWAMGAPQVEQIPQNGVAPLPEPSTSSSAAATEGQLVSPGTTRGRRSTRT